ncbi:hypothetical protein P2T68_27065 [Pseudomonas sp. G11]|uniref:hypothetical protein n=1 Tax=Pseudomonas sp. G11 TaxID=528343 RepID=UPI002402BB0A|nr:hypothetical protein [Pseudomonas sp. G11]WEX14246.1 hypothetical protein P2T68_27065 [Pseudomonas sp. G11]
MSNNSHYIEAIDQLVLERAEINLDTVALRAGRKRGSIKRGRLSQASLVKLIDDTAAQQRQSPAAPLVKPKKQAAKTKSKKSDDSIVAKSEIYQKALQKMVSIQFENHRLRMMVAKLETQTTD